MDKKTDNETGNGTTLLTYDLTADGLSCVRCGSTRFGDEGDGGFCMGCGAWVLSEDPVDLGGGDA